MGCVRKSHPTHKTMIIRLYSVNKSRKVVAEFDVETMTMHLSLLDGTEIGQFKTETANVLDPDVRAWVKDTVHNYYSKT